MLTTFDLLLCLEYVDCGTSEEHQDLLGRDIWWAYGAAVNRHGCRGRFPHDHYRPPYGTCREPFRREKSVEITGYSWIKAFLIEFPWFI